jgi:release factor glutamine methyltransferase
LPDAVASPSVADALRDATSVIAAAGSETPRLDAELLLADALHADRARLVIDASRKVERDALDRFRSLVARREAHEPVAYILGRKAFRHITLHVDRRVLIPRPETELLVEVGLSLPVGARVVDVGTGSGAVALALKSERPDLTVVGTDIEPSALVVARENGTRLGIDVEFVQADLLDGVGGQFDAVLANLPYVAEEADLPPDIGLYEPGRALFGGPDGLDPLRRLLPMMEHVPLVALEVQLAEAVESLLRGAGFRSVERLRDLAGLDRVVVARR